ncbi:MAG: type IV secretion system protein [Endozoicomonadaceae bacterium]|nr:type IV secretion system protein [Endozoicomonadaceae bacterium]
MYLKINKKIKDIASISYFQQANTWADDLNMSIVMSRNRYRFAFLGMSFLCGLLTIAIMLLTPLKRTQLVVVQDRGESGCLISTCIPGEKYTPSWSQTKSELARYIQYREGYDPYFYIDNIYRLQLMSSIDLMKTYAKTQRRNCSDNVVYNLGLKGIKRVSVKDIVLIKSNHHEIPGHKAQITFTVETELSNSDHTTKSVFMALITWEYRDPPKDIEDQLINWSGFQVTQYQRTQLSIAQ